MPIPGIISAIPEGLSAVFGAVTRRRDEIKAAVMAIWDKINAVADFATEHIVGASTWLFDHVWGGAKSFIGLLNVGAQFLGENFARAWKSVFDALARTAWWVGAKLFHELSKVLDFIGDRLGEVWQFVNASFDWIMTWGGSLIDLLMNLEEHVARVLAGAIMKVADEVGDAIDSYIDAHWND